MGQALNGSARTTTAVRRPYTIAAACIAGLLVVSFVATRIAEQPLYMARVRQLPTPVLDKLARFGAREIHPYSYPVALSPRGDMLLVKAKTQDSFELKIYKGAHLVASLKSASNPWELTWAPSGRCISYLAETGAPGIYSLNLWRIRESASYKPHTPVTQSAAFPIRWSSDGRFVAYTEYTHEESRLIVLSVASRSPPLSTAIAQIDPAAGYAWSPDSRQIAFSPSTFPTSIQVYNIFTHSARRLISLGSSSIRDLAWAPSASYLLAGVRLPSDNFYRLGRFSMTGADAYCPVEVGDLRSPVWTGHDGALAYILQMGPRTSVLWGRSCSDFKLVGKSEGGSLRLQNDGYRHQYLPLVKSGALAPPSISVIAHGFQFPTTPAAPSVPDGSVRVQPVSISSAGNATPAWLWKSKTEQPQRYGLVIVHGGPHLEETGEWEPLRLAFAKNGFVVLSINYSGSDGYGAAFENSSDLDAQAAELNAAVTYLEASQGIKPHNIVVMASSYGTEILIEALKRNSVLCGAIVFAPLLIGREALSNIEPLQYGGAVMAFHGARDPLCPPSVAVEYLRRLFAGSFVHRSAVSWRVFGNEGHGFSRTASLQEMYATIECTVTGSCDGVMRGRR